MFRHGSSRQNKKIGLSEQRAKRIPINHALADDLRRNTYSRRTDHSTSTMYTQQKSSILPTLQEGSLPLLEVGSKLSEAPVIRIPEKTLGSRPIQQLKSVVSSKLSTGHIDETHLKKLINQKIEEVRRNSSIHNYKDSQKKSTIVQGEPVNIAQLNSSRDLSQYGAFKKSTTSVSTNNQSNRFSIRR